MYSLPLQKLDSLFESIGTRQPLYIPQDNTSGRADFARWTKGATLSTALKTVRSAKDFFFPKTEPLVNFKISGKTIEVDDSRKAVEECVIIGVRACEEARFAIVAAVYLRQPPVHTYYKNTRPHSPVITLACTEPAQ